MDGTGGGDRAIDPRRRRIFARFHGGEIAAATSWEEQAHGLLHVGVITHPAYRRRGHGLAVGSAITAHGLDRGGVLQWQTLLSNTGSLAIGRALGYQQRFETVSVRLREVRVARR